ncbi:MAG: barnase inhibitor [Candidatus Wallbacteria bacterium HGW-Wallbacteria-1]|uniref:Barnase inhibitor n=1 Tax=Candidatus Wallbacteria bacterium HGW-Wallbacteria-1 TaxID=2013854 RepID=A0A2N1PG96_9BACT|nr:MAG: barnase inhibitor [Candidatus Wallbacteria bacterium HGW-Wallbacteria-1]
MRINRCTLNGLKINSLDDLYDRLAKRLSLPAHFGRNLDALWDVLSTDVEGPFEIVWTHSNDSKESMGKDFNRVVKLLKELKKERDDFKLTIEP